MMVAPIVLVFVPGYAVVESDLTGQPAFGQKFERAINGRKPNAVILLLNETIEFVGRKMVVGLKEGTQDHSALSRVFQPYPPQVIEENGLSLAHHLA
jgi:hypothetical protein